MDRQPTSRVYAGTTGQCLIREKTEVDQSERKRVVRDFEAGLKLVVDADQEEVRGVVPVVRSSVEAFVFVVDITDTSNPIRAFAQAVTATVQERDGWSLNEGSEMTQALRMVIRSADPRSTPNLVLTNPDQSEIQRNLNLVEAVSTLNRAFKNRSQTVDQRVLVVSTGKKPVHIDDQARYLLVGSPEAIPVEGAENRYDDTISCVPSMCPSIWSVFIGTGAFITVTGIWWYLDGTIDIPGILVATVAAIGIIKISSKDNCK